MVTRVTIPASEVTDYLFFTTLYAAEKRASLVNTDRPGSQHFSAVLCFAEPKPNGYRPFLGYFVFQDCFLPDCNYGYV